MRTLYYYLLFVFLLSSSLHADNVAGFWQTMNKKTNLPTSVVAVYPYEGKYYGRIIAIYNEEGILQETIYNPKKRAPSLVGDPFYCGLDIVWDAKPNTSNGHYKGYVIDPRKGKVYNAQIWKKGENLVLRGEVFVFGKNITWPPFPEKNFTKDFKKPDLSDFVPSIPQVKD
jgi:uncharacterized protein (DUF2147 family)